MKRVSHIRFIFIGIFSLLLFVLSYAQQCIQTLDFNTFEKRGLSPTIDWHVDYPQSVTCFSSDWQPSFFVTPDDLLDVRITGSLYIDASSNDNDFVGFVMGYQQPANGGMQNEHEFYLFDWKKTAETAPAPYGAYYAKSGYCFSKVSGQIANDPVEMYKYFWGHRMADVFQPLKAAYGDQHAWRYNKMYNFDIIYKSNYLSISINGRLLCEQYGSFEPGAFGLYSFAQSLVSYYNIRVTDLSNIYVLPNPNIEHCQDKPISFFVGTSEQPAYTYPYAVSYVWNFGDGSSSVLGEEVTHTYTEAGLYTIKLACHYVNDCIDTLYYQVNVKPLPQVLSHPQSISCSMGDTISFGVEGQNATFYSWYAKPFYLDTWTKLADNAYVSGVNTPTLTISNVPMVYDYMQYKCCLLNDCGQMVESVAADLDIANEPVHIKINTLEETVCYQDSLNVKLQIEGVSQMKTAHLVLAYPDSLINVLGVSDIYLPNVECSSCSPQPGLFVIDISTDIPVQQAQGVIGSLLLASVGVEGTCNVPLEWKDAMSYVIDARGDTLEDIFYNNSITHQMPILPFWEDSVYMCEDAYLELDTSLFTQYLWSTGATDVHIPIHQEGKYWVRLVDTNQCISTDSIYVSLNPKAQTPFSLTLQSDIICSNQDSVAFEVVGGMGDYLSYKVGNRSYLDTVSPPYVYAKVPVPQQKTPLVVRWHNACGASDSIESLISVVEVEKPWVSILSDHAAAVPGENITFTAVSEAGGAAPVFNWYIGKKLKQSGYSNVFQYRDVVIDNRVSVVMASDRVCLTQTTDTANYTIKLLVDDECFVPSLVSPYSRFNYFQPFFKQNDIYHFAMRIFDMQGKLVFFTQDRYDQWNGNGLLPKGTQNVFLYYIQYALENNKEAIHTKRGKFLLRTSN